jgi:hypothetical protein
VAHTVDPHRSSEELGIEHGQADIESLVGATTATMPDELDRLTVRDVRARALIIRPTRESVRGLLQADTENLSADYRGSYGEAAVGLLLGEAVLPAEQAVALDHLAVDFEARGDLSADD